MKAFWQGIFSALRRPCTYIILCVLFLPTIIVAITPQITATPTMAVPVLAFLSGLVLTPSLHHGFTVQEYLSVFAIALPYTNHQR